MVSLDRLLAPLPAAFTTAEAMAAGFSDRTLRRAVRLGRVRRVIRGVFVQLPAQRPSRREAHLTLIEAARLVRPHCAVSHHSAALLWGLPEPIALPEWVAMSGGPDDVTALPEAFLRLEQGKLLERHTVSHLGGLMTNPLRTLADCCRELPLGDGVALADAAVARGLLGLEDLREMRGEQRGWPFVRMLDTVLAISDPRRENWFESFSFAGLYEEGLPIPTAQVDICDRQGRFLGRVDGLWREQGTVGEADGHGKYLAATVGASASEAVQSLVLAEKVREDRIRDTGLEFVRWDFHDMTRARGVVAERVRRAFDRGDPGRFTGRLIVRPARLRRAA